MPSHEVFALYRNEAYFYAWVHAGKSAAGAVCGPHGVWGEEFPYLIQYTGQDLGEVWPWLPEVLEVQMTDDEILILMKKYQKLLREGMDDTLLRKIMGALAGIHVREIPDFLRTGRKKQGYLEKEQVENCLAGWRSVLAEHPGEFDEGKLGQIGAKINDIIAWHHGETQVLTHGDFHWDNLLRKKNGDIIVCDWQGVGIGGASGDISFFLSRLGADGMEIEPKKAVELYCRERSGLTGEQISPEELLSHGKAANIITSFQFWHEYLHGSSSERVREIYDKMAVE